MLFDFSAGFKAVCSARLHFVYIVVVDVVAAVVLCHSVSNGILHLCNLGFVLMPKVEMETVNDVLVNVKHCFVHPEFILFFFDFPDI